MKKKLFNILPSRLKKLRYADKIAHAFYGTAFYLIISLISNDLALFLTFALAIGVEVNDKYKDGKADMLDVLATIAIPIILFLL